MILPVNSSLSVTLSQDDLRSTTTIRADASFERDQLWLNGTEDPNVTSGRLGTCLREMRALRKTVEDGDAAAERLSTLPIRIVSENNFPTAAGLASSASGFAALVATLAALYQLPTSASDLSRIARQGSGSACRSLFGGFVAWQMGEREDGHDSLAVEVAPASHWPEMEAIICVVSDAKKGTPSTAGMQRTAQTSALLQHRIRHVVPARMQKMERAIADRDFGAFAAETMMDSNSFHACCLDTDPPIFYMNDVSRAIVSVVVELNRAAGRTVAAYTYDAGPNAVLYVLAPDAPLVAHLVATYFPGSLDGPRSRSVATAVDHGGIKLPDGFNERVIPTFPIDSVKEVIHTRVGDGPRRLDDSESLIGADGRPLRLAA